jgi:hypothetical protein
MLFGVMIVMSLLMAADRSTTANKGRKIRAVAFISYFSSLLSI